MALELPREPSQRVTGHYRWLELHVKLTSLEDVKNDEDDFQDEVEEVKTKRKASRVSDADAERTRLASESPLSDSCDVWASLQTVGDS